jgi:hypothetical protein
MLAVLSSEYRDVMAQSGRSGYVDNLNILPRHDSVPIGFDFRPPPTIGELYEGFWVRPADDLEHGLEVQIEKRIDVSPRVAVSAPHESVPNDGDI